jgi:hypothetical protein
MLCIIYIIRPLVMQTISLKTEHLVPIPIGRVCIKRRNNSML